MFVDEYQSWLSATCLINGWNYFCPLRGCSKEELFDEGDHSVLTHTHMSQETIACTQEASQVHRYNTW